jgi:hypothetical protein
MLRDCSHGAKRSVGREAYYLRELATDHEQYLSGHGESPGRWYGAGATTLGLYGEASVAGFQAMFEGRDPTTGELLEISSDEPGQTLIAGPVTDQAALYGLLAKIRDLNLPLLSVRRLDPS